MPTLILVRHGQSQWNLENRFTGWVDVDLAPKGIEEAKSAGRLLKDMKIDHVFTSVLKRAKRTADFIMHERGLSEHPRSEHQSLNERHYGDLQGLNKDECRTKFGEEQVHIWRRSYDIAPPGGESLQNTQERVLPYYREHIRPLLEKGDNVLVVAHGNSLRALVMELEGLSPDDMLSLNIPTGVPLLYEFDADMNLTGTTTLEEKEAA